MLLDGTDHRVDFCICLSSGKCAETTCYLDFDFHLPYIPLCLVVVKWHTKIMEEQQEFFRVSLQTIQETPCPVFLLPLLMFGYRVLRFASTYLPMPFIQEQVPVIVAGSRFPLRKQLFLDLLHPDEQFCDVPRPFLFGGVVKDSLQLPKSQKTAIEGLTKVTT